MQRPVVVLLLMCAVAAPLIAAQQAAPAPDQPIATGVSAVVVDTVVRDRRGQPVTGLGKAGFELFEDGVRQQIADVTVVGVAVRIPEAGADRAAADAPRAHTGIRSSAPPSEGPTFTAIVFDRLSAEARGLAYQGALACLETLRANDYVAVFLSDLSLTTIQTYTNDPERLRRALKDVASRPTAIFDRTATRDPGQDQSRGDAHPSVPVVASPESIGRPVDTRNQTAPDIAELQVRTHASWEVMAREQQGYATTNALIAVTTGLGTLPGRKGVIFFAEGLAIPDAVLPHFRNVVMTANRGNVSVYTIDSAGLRVHSKNAETSREVRGMGLAGLAVTADGSNKSSLAMLERNEDVLRKDPSTSLTLLAQETGGFLVENTNDLADAFRRIDADRRFHYLLTYTPSNGDVDGRWRSISVRVPGREVTIRARSGYLAVRSPMTVPLLAYEGPALAALDRTPAPSGLPLRAAALVFPAAAHADISDDRAGPARVAVLASTDATTLRFDPDSKTGTYRTDFTMVARIVNSAGEIVRKASQPYALSGPMTQVEQAQRGAILFFRQPLLDAGRYTLEVAVHDTLAVKTGVTRVPFVVPDWPPRSLQVSSLVIVRRAERVPPGERPTDNPLYFGDAVIYPNLGEPLRSAQDTALTLFVVARAGPGSPPTAAVEIVRDGAVVARAPAALPGPDSSGRIEHVMQIPLGSLSPGPYVLRFTVTQTEHRQVREAAFVLIE